MGGLFLHYLSKYFDNPWKGNFICIYIYAIMGSDNDRILGSIKDLLGVCEWILWEVA